MANKIYMSFSTKGEAVSGIATINLQARDEKGSVIDSTDVLFKQSLSEYNASEPWVGQIRADELIRNSKYIEFFKTYSKKAQIWFDIKVYTDKTGSYKSTVIIESTALKLDEGMGGFNFQDINIDKNFELPSLSYDIENINKLKIDFKDLEAQYLAAKAQYETEVKDAGLIVFEQNEPYEPSDGTYIITRMLEFQLGTLIPAIRHFKTIQNNAALRQAQVINQFLTQLTNLFPDITLDDGEGMPYNG